MTSSISLFSPSCIWHKKEQQFFVDRIETLSVEPLSAYVKSHFKEVMGSEGNQNALKKRLGSFSERDVRYFFSEMLMWGLENNQSVIKIASLIDLDNSALQAVVEEARAKAPLIKSRVEFKLANGKSKLYTFSYIRAIPNMLSLLIGTLDYLDPFKRYLTIWDRFLLIGIFWKAGDFFCRLVELLSPALGVASFVVYGVAAGIIAGVGGLVSLYQNRLQPAPTSLLKCENMTDAVVSEERVGQKRALEDLKRSIKLNQSLTIVGPSGAGKSFMTEALVQLHREGKLGEDFKKTKFFSLKGGSLVNGDITFSQGQQLEELKKQIGSHYDQIVLVIDEAGEVLKNLTCLEAIKTWKPNPTIILIATDKDYSSLIASDIALRRRFRPLYLDVVSKEEGIEIARKVIRETTAKLKLPIHELPFSKDGLEKIVEMAASYDPEVGQPANITEITQHVVERCSRLYVSEYISEEETVLLRRMESFKTDDLRTLTSEQIKAFHQMQGDLGRLREEVKSYQQVARQIQQLKKWDMHACQQANGFVRKIASQDASQVDAESCKKVVFYQKYVLPILQDLIEQKLQSLRGKVPIEINKTLIEQVVSELKIGEVSH